MSQTKVQLIKDGALAEDSIVHDGDTNTKIRFSGADTITAETAGSERLRVDSSGNIGIGKTPSRTLDVEGKIRSSDAVCFGNNSATPSEGVAIHRPANSTIAFVTNDTERSRLDSSGRFLVGKTSNGVGQVGAELRSGNSDYSVVATSNGHTALIVNRLSSTGELVQFRQANTTVGHISVTSSSTSYNTSSDYRLKENVVAISDGITRLKTLKPSRFNFIIDETNTLVDGFLAHEVTAVPEAISGTKDETQDILYTEEDTIPSGKKVGDVKETVPKYQGIDQSKLVPLLTAALQEAIAKIEVLETKVAALEAA